MKPFHSSHSKNEVKNAVNFLPLMFKLGLNVTKLRCEKPIEIKMFELWTTACNMLKSIISYHQTYAQLQTRKFGTSWDWLKPYITCCHTITHASISSLTNSCLRLTSLRMESCSLVSREGFLFIGRCQLLEELDVTDTEIDDQGCISNLTFTLKKVYLQCMIYASWLV